MSCALGQRMSQCLLAKAAALHVQGQNEIVKFHATVMNTRYRRGQPASQQGRRGKPQRMPFDGGPLLAHFANLDLGEFVLSAVHLSKRGSKDDNGYYQCAQALQL